MIADGSRKAGGSESERSSPYIRRPGENQREDGSHASGGSHAIREEREKDERTKTDKERRSSQTDVEDKEGDRKKEDKQGENESADDEKERGEHKKKSKATGRLPLHLKRARERYESATYLVREVSRSPLTRYNRLLVAEAIDRWWRAWQLRRFAGLVKKKFKVLKHLGRQFKVTN